MCGVVYSGRMLAVNYQVPGTIHTVCIPARPTATAYLLLWRNIQYCSVPITLVRRSSRCCSSCVRRRLFRPNARCQLPGARYDTYRMHSSEANSNSRVPPMPAAFIAGIARRDNRAFFGDRQGCASSMSGSSCC